MDKKIFISYAHKDEKYKEELVEHMSGLRRAGIISEWNDRKIVPGQNWSEQISPLCQDSCRLICYFK